MICIFLGTTNRLDTLTRTLASLDRLTTPHEIVIVDNGTYHPKCLELLGEVEKRVRKVYSFEATDVMEALSGNFNRAIKDQYNDPTNTAEWFAVTEADICFDGAPRNTLQRYIQLARAKKRPVGPHLRVSDVPACYPLRSRVLACETWMLYKKDFSWFNGIPYTATQIDTTFHLFPRTDFFDRLNLDPLRVGPPYDAMHLDWYLDVFEPTEENQIYISDRKQIGSWGKAWIRAYWEWFQEHGPEVAYEALTREPRYEGNICNASMIRSWCLQFGVGVGHDQAESEKWLEAAIPHWKGSYYWPKEADWKQMIYKGDMSALGWECQ